MIIYLKVKI